MISKLMFGAFMALSAVSLADTQAFEIPSNAQNFRMTKMSADQKHNIQVVLSYEVPSTKLVTHIDTSMSFPAASGKTLTLRFMDGQDGDCGDDISTGNWDACADTYGAHNPDDCSYNIVTGNWDDCNTTVLAVITLK